jgi:hypothetical protein
MRNELNGCYHSDEVYIKFLESNYTIWQRYFMSVYMFLKFSVSFGDGTDLRNAINVYLNKE